MANTTETLKVSETLTQREAEALTDRIRESVTSFVASRNSLIELIAEAKHGKAHEALSFKTWADYVAHVFNDMKGLSSDDLELCVGLMSGEGMSSRSIAHALNISQSKAVRMMKASNETSALVIGKDGRVTKRVKSTDKTPESEAKAKAKAEHDKAKADSREADKAEALAKADADKTKADADKAKAEADKAKAEADKAKAEADKAKAGKDKVKADKAKADADKAKADADKAKADADKAEAQHEHKAGQAKAKARAEFRLRMLKNGTDTVGTFASVLVDILGERADSGEEIAVEYLAMLHDATTLADSDE